MAEVLKVVSAPVEDRTTLLDLVFPACRISGFSAPAPRLRRASVSSFQVDGSMDAATAWEDRELTIEFVLQGGTEDLAALLLQTLARTFSQPRWLEFSAGTSKPVFFRTRATTLDEVLDYGPESNPGVRSVKVVIPADPFAYGLPESGTKLVPNDPSDGGMQFSLENVKGDAPAPLRMDCAFSVPTSRVMIGSSPTGLVNGTAEWLDTFTPEFAAGGWTKATKADSSAIGGTRNSATTPGTTTVGRGTIPARLTFSDIEPGDYRLLVRMKVSRASGDPAPRLAALPEWPGAKWVDLLSITDVPASAVPSNTNTWQWVDFGVMRLPGFSRQASPWEPRIRSNASVRFLGTFVASEASPTEVSLDHALLVPAPGADGVDGRLLVAGWNLNKVATPGRFVVSPGGDSVFSDIGGASITWSPLGGFPTVTPGVTNTVTLVQRVAQASDSKTATTTVNWSYHPRYLTIRGD